MTLPILRELTRLTDSLYVSGAFAVNSSNITNHGITNIINLTRDVPNLDVPGVTTKRISLDDSPSSDLSRYFDVCADLIHSVQLHGGKTLVHCVAGVSRSVTICLVYLMKYRRYNLANAFEYIRSRRFIINPNYGFWKQLIAYEESLFGRCSVAMVFTDRGVLEPDIYARTQNISVAARGEFNNNLLPFQKQWQTVTPYRSPGNSSTTVPAYTSRRQATPSQSTHRVQDLSYNAGLGWSGDRYQQYKGPGMFALEPYAPINGNETRPTYVPNLDQSKNSLQRYYNSNQYPVYIPQRFLDRHTVYMSPSVYRR